MNFSGYGSAASSLANMGLEGADAATCEGAESQRRLLRGYAERNLPDLVNREASRGTFYGGQAGVRADRLKLDTGEQYGDIGRAALYRQQAAAKRAGILAAAGVVL